MPEYLLAFNKTEDAVPYDCPHILQSKKIKTVFFSRFCCYNIAHLVKYEKMKNPRAMYEIKGVIRPPFLFSIENKRRRIPQL